MQKQNYFLVLSFFLYSFFLSSCEIIDHDRAPGATPATPIATAGGPACYLNSCFETTTIGQITDPNKDYAYPDPKNFKDESLRPQYIKPFSILDLQNINPDTKLATNFKLGDFMSLRKGRYGLFSSNVVSIIQYIRNEVNRPLYVTSGYRSPGYNKNTDGSATWSRHTYGDALDFSIQGLAIADLPDFCKKHGASFTLTYEAHVHCDWRKAELDPAYYEPTSGKLKQIDSQLATAKLISEQSRIIFKLSDNQIELSAHVPLHEDEEGTPTHDWRITLPSGETLHAETATVILPKMSGELHIQVTIGGSIHLDEFLTW